MHAHRRNLLGMAPTYGSEPDAAYCLDQTPSKEPPFEHQGLTRVTTAQQCSGEHRRCEEVDAVLVTQASSMTGRTSDWSSGLTSFPPNPDTSHPIAGCRRLRPALLTPEPQTPAAARQWSNSFGLMFASR